ncbi:MAG: SGNH/GDSL hydrolase family protein [Microthrixaceae bacterium]
MTTRSRYLHSRAVGALVAVCLLAVLATSCLPVAPSLGRGTPVRRVLLLGDSVAYGLFGTSPRVHEPLTAMLADRGIETHVTGYPAENPIFNWPMNLPWLLRMQHEIETWDPDMVIIQTTLFVEADEPGKVEEYRKAIAELMDLAQSRGAHVYIVKHHGVPGTPEAHQRDVAEVLQNQAAAPRGIFTIPLDWWMDRCAGGLMGDGVHLTEAGQRCNALAMTYAVDQLRGAVG